MIRSARLAVLATCAAAMLFADFSYQEKTQVTGGALGAMMRTAGGQAPQPMTSTVLIKGNRMAHLRADTAQIIDLDKETITNINFPKKTYTLMTFAQMKQMMQDMSQRTGQQPAAVDAHFKNSVRETGKTKNIGGLNTTEKIMTMSMEGADAKSPEAMVIQTDMWIASEIPGYAEVRNFYRRMAEKSGWAQGSFGPSMGARGMPEAMAAMAKERSKLNGMPVLQVMSMSGGGSEGLGALAALGTHKGGKDAGSNAEAGVTIEMTTESSGFSSNPVDASKFDVPAGFQQVEANAMRRGRK